MKEKFTIILSVNVKRVNQKQKQDIHWEQVFYVLLCLKETIQVEVLSFIQSPKFSMTQIEGSIQQIFPKYTPKRFRKVNLNQNTKR